ncbi:MAG: N-acetyl-gamma-glutamyl-phosphate reductase [Candidatus Omnitrophota bacterium]|nr:N-acetyl-gamma-glutamyl-phosphate reductase [Candidatus Omnitrophota bacterium]
MLKIGIMGASGFAGEELIKILLKHPEVKITALAAKIERTHLSKMYPWAKGMLDIDCYDMTAEDVGKKSDVVFLALPHKISMDFAPELLKQGKKVIDLSADFRIQDKVIYEKWYEIKHECPELIKKAVYGLPELYRKDIKGADLIANPGCYPTSIILGCAPLLKKKLVDTDNIICDSKSGVSGAGRTPTQSLMFTEIATNSFRPYKVNFHRHMPEIDQELSNLAGAKIEVNFIPHLVPMERGILSTIYLKLNKKIDTKEALGMYKDFYKGEYFVRVLEEGILPDTKNVVRSNFCDIGIKVFPEKSLAVVMTAIDNLVKGASGQAVQNMNIMYGFDEKLGL